MFNKTDNKMENFTRELKSMNTHKMEILELKVV